MRVKIQITDSEAFSFLGDVNLDLIFDAEKPYDTFVIVDGKDLFNAGAPEWVQDDFWNFAITSVKIVGSSDGVPPEQLGLNSKCGPTTCTDVSHKCCNQFGERDEIQTIINSLQADVVARGNRITELERALQGEQRKSEQLYNLALELGACSEFMKVNFACEWVGDVDD